MRNATLQRALLAGTLAFASGVGCPAEDGDTVSRQLVAVTLPMHAPDGILMVSDDGSYEFVDSSSRSKHDGILSSAEMAALKDHLASPRLDALYAFKDPTGNRCSHEAAGLLLSSRVGTACIIKTDIDGEDVLESFDFFVALFDAKAAGDQ
jgi:hypothetical protein